MYAPYTADEVGAPMTLAPDLREALRPKKLRDTMTGRVLYAWREHFGLSMTAHLLCHVMGRPWSEIRGELTTEYADGFFRTIDCPDIRDIAYYIDYPISMIGDTMNRVTQHMHNVEYSDQKIELYPPEQGYANSWRGEPSKVFMFREKAHTHKNRTQHHSFTSEAIIETLRAACHAK